MQYEKDFISAIEQNRNIIHKVCNLYMSDEQDKKDLFQEIVLAAWKGFKHFRGDAKFSTWLYRVALNTAITFYRKDKRQVPVIPLQEQINVADTDSTSYQEQVTAMYHSINELSRIDKALVMLYMEDYSYADIADVMGITANHVAVKMNRIKTKLKDITKKYL